MNKIARSAAAPLVCCHPTWDTPGTTSSSTGLEKFFWMKPFKTLIVKSKHTRWEGGGRKTDHKNTTCIRAMWAYGTYLVRYVGSNVSRWQLGLHYIRFIACMDCRSQTCSTWSMLFTCLPPVDNILQLSTNCDLTFRVHAKAHFQMLKCKQKHGEWLST